MSFDFALKDFYRKKSQTYPYVLIITLVIAFAEFLIYFTISLGLNQVFSPSQGGINKYFFTGAISIIYSGFNTVIIVLVLILAFIIVVVVTTTLVISKKRDIAIMKAIGTLPHRLYGFYIREAYFIFFVGFILGVIFGLISFGIFALILFFFNFPILFQIDLFYTPILFLSCIAGIFVITGYKLRKIGTQNIIKTFSEDIPYNYDASQRFTIIPRWLSSLGFNLKIAVVNTIRRKGEFKRYLIIFTLVFLIIFTLGLGIIVLGTSQQEWIRKSQGENIIIIGHKDTIHYYSQMYEMFSDPSILVNEDDIEFTKSKYLFNLSNIKDIEDIDDIEKIDGRLIKFCDLEEVDGYHYLKNVTGGGYEIVGQQRTGIFPIIGVNSTNIIQNFEIEGRFFTKEDEFDNMTIGDGLAYNFFDYAFDQSLKFVSLGPTFHISGVVIDSFYNGYAGYISLDIFQEELNLTTQINLVLLQFKSGTYNDIKNELETIIENNLGSDFTHQNMNEIFKKNLEYIFFISLSPIFLIIFMSIIAILSLYNYQKAGLMDKAKDFLIMRAMGSKNKSLKRILFLEALFVIIPSLVLSLGIGMILNSIVLFERVYLPPLYVPILLISIIFIALMILNFLSLIPIMKKINRFTIKDFDIY